MQDQLLYAPVGAFRHVDLVLRRARQSMTTGELLQIAPGLADHTKHFALECHLEDPRWPRAFPQEHHLVWSARDAQRVGSTDPVGAARRRRRAIDRPSLEVGWDLDLPLPQVLA